MAVGTQHHERALVRMPTLPARASERLRIKLPIFLVLLAIAASTVYPLLFLALNALKERTDYYASVYGLPRELYLGNFTVLIENYNIVRALLNSVFVTGIAVTATLLIATIASFALAKVQFVGQRILFALIVAFLLVPGQVLLIPVYLLFSRLDLINNYLSVILI